MICLMILGKMPWRRKWQPIPSIFAWRIPWIEEPGRLQWGCKELETTERLQFHFSFSLLHLVFLVGKHCFFFFFQVLTVSSYSLLACNVSAAKSSNNFMKEPLYQFSSVQFSRSVVSDSPQPHEFQHARPPCPSPSPRVHSNSHPSSW